MAPTAAGVSPTGRPPLWAIAVAGAAAIVIVTIALASERVSKGGASALVLATFLLAAGWCFSSRREDLTLVAVALYLGLLDGYVKLRTGNPTVTLARDVLVFAVAAGALVRAVAAHQKLVWPPLGGFVLAFSAVVLVELANPASRGLTASLAGVRQHLEFVPLFFLGYACVRTESQVRKTLLLLVFCAAVGGVVSYVQSRLTPDQLAAWGPGYAERIHGAGVFQGARRVAFLTNHTEAVRPFGLGSEIGSGAVTAALAFPGLLALLMLAKGRLRWALMPLAVGVGLAVATSGSRGGLITVFVSMVAFALIGAASDNAVRAVVGLLVGVALVYGVFVQLGPSNVAATRARTVAPSNLLSTFSATRGASVLLAGRLAESYPLGVGLGTVGPAGSFGQTTAAPGGYNAETEWNFLLIETGVAGVLVYVAFLSRLMWLAFKRIRHVASPTLRLYLAALAAPILGLFAAGFGGPTTASTPAAPFFWLVSGVLAYWLVTAFRTQRLAEPEDMAQHTPERAPGAVS